MLAAGKPTIPLNPFTLRFNVTRGRESLISANFCVQPLKRKQNLLNVYLRDMHQDLKADPESLTVFKTEGPVINANSIFHV